MSKGQQTPYIGSRISLISKLDIRYEGVLFSVDTNESTIALAKVKSFGTEDRVPNNPIPGRDDVYEYIIFKAGDIKDLLVCENPKPVATANDGLPYDPAIVTVSTAPEPQQPAPSAAPALPTAAVVPPVTTAPVPPTSASVAPPKPKPAPVSSPTFAAVASAAAPVGSSRASPPAVIPQRGGYAPRFHRGGPGGAHRGVRNDSGGFYAPRGGYYRGAARGGGRFYPTTEKLRFDSDYDFEKANEQFQETLTHLTRDMKKTTLDDVSDDDIPDVVEGDVAKEETEEDEKTYYDKKNSFFDSISCEALEKEAGRNNRPDWRKERMTNQETFGHSAVRSLSYRRGGRGYGYRGNRGYNGGGGGGYYQNRQGHGQNLNQGGGYDGGRRRF